MSAQIVTLVSDASNTGKNVDTNQIVVGANTVQRQNISIADPATAAAIVNVTQFHASDNQALGTFYGLATGGISQTVNISGNLDRARGVQGDQLQGTGLPCDVSMLTQIGTPVKATNTVTAGSNKTINIGSTANLAVGGIVQVDTGANMEWARVNAVVANTSITVDTLVNGHTLNQYSVFPIIFNMPRDASGELDLSGGTGANMAVDYNFDGATFQRQRNVCGLNVYTDTSASNLAASTVPIAIATTGSPPQLPVGTVILVDALGTNPELAQVTAVNVAGKTITVASLANAHNGSVTAFQIAANYQGLAQVPANFGPFGIAAEAAVLVSGVSATTGLQQYSVEKDVNAAGLTPTQGAASGAGVDADCVYGMYLTSVPALTNKQMSPLQLDVVGDLLVGVAGTIKNNLTKPTVGSPIQNLNATKVAVKASAGTLYGFIIENNQAAATYIQLFDVASAGVTLGTTKPDLEYFVAASSMGFIPLPTQGWPFGTALTAAATTASGGLTGSANGVTVYPVYA